MNKNLSAKHLITIVALELLFALPLGLALTKFLGGVAWIFGGIGAGALVLNAWRIFYGVTPKPNRKSRLFGQAMVGLAIGCSMTQANLGPIALELPIFAFLTLFVLLTGALIGYIYSRVSKTNLLNAMLATVPGGVGVMSSIAADYNRNVSLVALVQVIRVTTVVLAVPILARLAAGESAIANLSAVRPNWFNIDIQSLPLLFLAFILTFVGIRIASYLKIPAAPFFGSLVIGVCFNPLLNFLPLIHDLDFTPPQVVNLIGQTLLGISVGEYWGTNQNLGRKTVGYALIPVGMTIGSGLLAAAIAMILTPWDWLTCLLVTAPGGAAEMILVSLSLDHNVEIVTAGHLVRLMAINASLPLWVSLFRYLEGKLPEADNKESAIARRA